MKTIPISYDATFEAKTLYGTLRALDDLLLTISDHPEKEHLILQIEREKGQVQYSITEWWEKIAKATGFIFSDNAKVRFDASYIID